MKGTKTIQGELWKAYPTTAAAASERGMDVQYPKTFFDALQESMRFVEESRSNEGMSKADVLDSMEKRLSFIMAKMLGCPTSTSFCMFRKDCVEASLMNDWSS